MPQMSARPQLVIIFDAHHPWISPPIGSDGLEKANVSPRFLHQSASGMPKLGQPPTATEPDVCLYSG
jgi:hypothetical protein